MQERSTKGSFVRMVLFMVIAFTILLLNMFLNPAPKPKPQQVAQQQAAAPDAAAEKADGEATQPGDVLEPSPESPGEEPSPAAPDDQTPRPGPAVAAAPEPEIASEWITLGSADPADPYRMLATLSNRGASLVRVELNSERYRDLEDRSGYLGHVAPELTTDVDGCRVQVVGAGTPAALAGLKKDDLITAFDGNIVSDALALGSLLQETKPGETVTLTVLRDGKTIELPVTLGWHPLEVIRPEGSDPWSFLLTMSTLDTDELEATQKQFNQLKETREALVEAMGKMKAEGGGPAQAEQLAKCRQKLGELAAGIATLKNEEPPATDELKNADAAAVEFESQKLSLELDAIDSLAFELDGVQLRKGAWEVASHSQTEVVFRRELSGRGIELLKTFRLAEVPAESAGDANYKAYHLTLDVEIRNTDQEAHKVAYQLDGPTGLPIEGYWYAYKVSRSWGSAGLRDVVVSFNNAKDPVLIPCPKIATGDIDPPWQGDEPLDFMGVDAQYFSAVMMPQKNDPSDIWFASSQPLRVGPVDRDWLNKTNTSFRVTSRSHELAPGASFSHSVLVFAGPKKPDLLAEYGLGDVVYYGWFGWVAKPMLAILHGFYSVVRNYGIAIILLTVLVRLCMFPISRKQAMNAQKMAELQPEIKKLQEKHKKDFEARNKAQQELFRKHNYNPLSGCLVVFLQLPIFLGLYRGLMVDVELRQAPLISESIRWCSNLAAPDMLFNWSSFMPAFIASGKGMLGLGPYFNLLPVLTIFFFIAQQKMLMPPPADEQAKMQQNIMKYMMIFMGVMFFKVASGLCIYFIASSAWGLAERKLLPKSKTPPATSSPPPRRVRGKR